MLSKITNKIILFSLLSLAWMAPPSSSFAFLKVETLPIAAGPTAWLVEDHELPIITLNISWRGGAAQDPEDRAGLTTLLASLLNEGAGDYDSRAFQDQMAFLGTTINFNAEQDSFTASVQMLRRHRKASFALLRAALLEPRFDDEAIQRMKAEIKTFLQMERENPSARARDLWHQTAFKGHPYAIRAEGTAAGLAKITAQDLRQRHQALLRRDNVIISLFGDISAAEAQGFLNEIFEALPEAETSHTVKAAPAHQLSATGVRVEAHEGPQSAVYFGWPGVATGEDDFFPAYVLNYIMGGGGFSSRLVEEIREKRGLTYSIYSYLRDSEAEALWIGGFTSDRTTVMEAIELLKAEIGKLQQHGVSATELADAKTYLQGSYALRFDSGSRIVEMMNFVQWYDLSTSYFEKRNQFIAAVTLDDINRVARTRLDPEKLLIQLVGEPIND